MKDFIAKTFEHPVQRAWLMLLMFINMVMPLFYLDRIEGRVTLLCIAAALIIGMGLFKLQGYTRLLGVMHFPWIPLLIFLWGRLAEISAAGIFGIWIRSIILLNGISLTIDISDVVRYIAGDHKQLK